MTYPQQPAYGGPPPPGYGYGYGYPPQRPGTALAYTMVAVFLVCGLLALIFAIISWSGNSGDNPDVLAAVIGIVFSEDITGNVDFGISATMTVACTTITFALVALARLEAIRWILAVLGGLVTAYYLYAIIYLLANDGGSVIALPIVSFLLWLGATVVALLPATGRAMRGKGGAARPPYPPGMYQQGGYPPGQQRYPGYYGPR